MKNDSLRIRSPTSRKRPGALEMSKPNYRDIARHAGVGTATVERVLNGRGGVRPELVEKVISAARSLDYPRKLPDAHRGLLRDRSADGASGNELLSPPFPRLRKNCGDP